jgi:LacI family transcriptional regulator
MRHIDGCTLPYVGQDNANGARKATRHLIALGHTRIAFFGGDEAITTRQERYQGYCQALRAAGLPVLPDLLFETEVSKDGGRQAMECALASAVKPTAAVCYNDLIAIGATRALAVRGLRAGEDFAIVGFDNLSEAKDNFPPLTTIDAETMAMGDRAAQILIDLIDGPASPAPTAVTGGSSLVVRESCGAHLTGRAGGTSNRVSSLASLTG